MSNVILIGYMGCGKSTVGIRLSYRLKMPYVDTDKLIEKQQGTTICCIFKQKGEEAFRDMETECLKDLFDNRQDYVISVGGGLALRQKNRDLMAQLGKVIYLRAKPETIYDRVKGDTARPLLQCDNPEERIRQMLEVRGPVYESAAQIVIDVDGKSFDEILDEIQEAVIK